MIRLTAMFSLLASTAMAGEIWVTNEKDDTISVISTETLEVIKTYETGERRGAFCFPRIIAAFTSALRTATRCR